MAYSQQGLRDLVTSSKNARSAGMPDELARLKFALMRSGDKAGEIINRIPSLASSYNSDADAKEFNTMPPMSGDTPANVAMPAELPLASNGFGMNSPRGGPVNLAPSPESSPEDNYDFLNRTPIPQQSFHPYLVDSMNDAVGEGDNPSKKSAEDNLKEAPTAGKAALVGQNSDIEKMLGKYTNNEEDSGKHFTDFLKLTLARAAMSKDSNMLAALSEGAGKATIDQQEQGDREDRNRLAAINQLASLRDRGSDNDLKRQEFEAKKPLYAAEADYYKDRGDALGQPKDTKVPLGFDGAAEKAIKLNYGDQYTDLDPSVRSLLKSKAADIWKEARGRLSTSQAMDEAISKNNAQSLVDESPWYSRKSKWTIPSTTSPSKEVRVRTKEGKTGIIKNPTDEDLKSLVEQGGSIL